MKRNKRIYLVDTTLRDGSHAVSHQYTQEKTRTIAKGLAESGVDFIEISHGDGLSGSSQNYGWGLCTDRERLEATQNSMGDSNLTVMILPGIGTVKDLKIAQSCGANTLRVATHVTEADVGEQHIRMAKESGMTAMGFLMMIHMASVEKLVEQAKLFESYGADVVYVADSAGTMLPDEVEKRVAAVAEAVLVPVGFHAHNNFGLAIGNDLAAIKGGATYLDATLRGLGAGAGNAPIEELAAVLDKAGYEIGADIYRLMDVAESEMEDLARDSSITTSSLMIGYAGVYSSFLLHTKRAAERFNLNPRDILVELGRRKMVGGQEDMIIDVAYELSKQAE